MSANPHIHGEWIADAAGITAAEAAPSGASAGVDATGGAEIIVWGVSGGTSCSLTFWWYNDLSTAWEAGETVTVSGNARVEQWTDGDRCDLQITGITGTYRRDYKFVTREG